ncbi:TetR/AcrR family transcriptional regulator [Marinoscillum sp. 108]|uniref:TetR/AcrR family transcriptional regulator n=1 Tax=Marinoscillum sp. 108 TaxID=2653151 RepID=UPI0012F2AFE9|nr:TetR/AcrR family transcriptional regulator [Marinoscillum sp. 108]VXD11479.1 TetR/AcrR family transcriptional regulator [Marinoscillum sp. 108]
MGGSNKKNGRQLLLQTGRTLFWKYGVRRISVEEVCKSAGVSKMTFYRSFENKEDLAFQVLKGFITEGMDSYRAVMKQDIPFREKIAKVIALKHQQSVDISQEFIQEIYQSTDSVLSAYIEESRKEMLSEIMYDLFMAQQNGWIRRDTKLEFILYMLNSLNDKMMDERFLSMYEDKHDAIMDLTNFFFYGIFPSEQPE